MLLPIKNSRKQVFFGYGTKVLETELNCRFLFEIIAQENLFNSRRTSNTTPK